MTNRMQGVDIARGIAIILVVFGHLIPLGFVYKFIFSFHMPLFFFFSGFCTTERIKEKKFAPYLLKKVVTLLIPCWIYVNLYFMIRLGSHDYFAQIKDNLLLYIIPQNEWFLPTLFGSSILLWLFSRIDNKIKSVEMQTIVYLLAFVICAGFANSPIICAKLGVLYPYLFFRFDHVFTCFCFQIAGFWLRNKLPQITDKKLELNFYSKILILFAGVLSLLYTRNNSLINICSSCYGKDYLLFFAVAFYWIAIIYLLSKTIYAETDYLRRILQFLGRYSLYIYIGQGLMIAGEAQILGTYSSLARKIGFITWDQIGADPYRGGAAYCIIILLVISGVLVATIKCKALLSSLITKIHLPRPVNG